MRDKNLSFIQFSEQIEIFIKRKMNSIKILTEAVVNNPTLLDQNFILRFQTNKLFDLRGLALVSYFVPEILGWKIRFEIEERLKFLNTKDKLRLIPFLYSKEISLIFLFLSDEFSSHEIFGNLIERGLFSLRAIKIFRKNPRVKRRIRRRGYDDKGSRRSNDKALPDYDFTLTEAQNKIERKKDIYIRSKNSLENFLIKEKKKFFPED